MTEAGGYKLFLTDRATGSGYRGVVKNPGTGKYDADRGAGTSKHKYLGSFNTAVEAAVAYAAAVAQEKEEEEAAVAVEKEKPK